MMAEHAIGKKDYYYTFAALMVLLLLTVIFAYLNLGPFNIVVALAIAITKAALVVLFFMHAKASERLVWVFISAGLVWLIILIGGTAQDVLTRGWFSGKAPREVITRMK
jgi:cytochrome c oxidase subunit 4